MYAYTRHYFKFKARAPHTTSARCVVPIWSDPPPLWLDHSAGMSIIRQYPAGADIFVQPGGKGVTSPYNERICYDPMVLPPPPPKPVLSCVDRLLAVAAQEEHEPTLLPVTCTPTMIFPLSCNSVAGTALADSGERNSFARHAYIKAAGIKILPCPEVRINLADGDSVLPVLGMARLKITIHRKVTMVITAFVLPDLVHGVDLILGESWLKSHKVTLDYRTNKCIIHRPKGKVTLKSSDSIILTSKSSWTAALSSAAAPVFSARQALRSLKRGAKPMLVLVREAQAATGVMSAEADTGHATSCAGCSVSAAHPPQATININSTNHGTISGVAQNLAKSKDWDAFPRKLVLDNDTSVLQKSSFTNQPPTDVVGLIPESALQALLGEYADVLSAPPEDREIGHFAVGHTIPLVPGAVPPFRRAPRLSPKEEAAARAHIAEMIKKYIYIPL